MESRELGEAAAFMEANREVLKKFYEDRESDWKTGRVGGCDAAASLARADEADLSAMGIPFAEVLTKAHTTGPKTVFDALRSGKITEAQLERYLTTGLTADGKRWELLTTDETTKDDFEKQARATIQMLKGANDARLPEYRKELEVKYYPEPIHASKNLNVYDGACQYPFLRGLRDGVNHQMQYVAEKKLLVYSYMGDQPADALGAVVRPFGAVRKSYGESFVIMENVEEDTAKSVIAALEAKIGAEQERKAHNILLMDETTSGEVRPQPEERGGQTREAALPPEAALTPRERRIVEEETRLAQRPDQRRANVLDYLRRGRLKDARVSIHPDLVQLVPKLLESDVVDFSAPTYDEQRTIQRIVEACADVLRDASDTDDAIRRQLASWRVTGPDGRFLDAEWATALQKQIDAYAAMVTRPNSKHPLAGDPGAYRVDVRKRWAEKFSGAVTGQIDHLMDAAEAGGVRFDLPAAEPSEDAVAAFLHTEIRAQKEPIQKYPSLETYRGETISSPPDFRSVKVKPGLRMSERDEVPAHGGFIFDGNFGYSPDGELIKPANTEIIDHHDALNEKQYDTATIMASRTWERRLGQKFTNRGWADELRNLKKGGFFDEEGKHLITMVNDPDTDAMLALWVFRNPRRSEQYTTILNNISTCGDFLVGSRVMEYGATARDYNYIIMNYLEACKRKILEEKREDAAKSGEEFGAVIGAIRDRREEIVRESPELVALQQEADALRGEKEMSKEAQRARGIRIAEITKRIEQAVKEALGPVLIAQEQEAQAALTGVQKNVAEMDAVLSSKRDIKLGPEENAKIVSHFLDRMEDIVTNPFKYKKYLLAGREKEERGFQQVEQWYRSGEMEIRPYEKDPDIIMILPQEGKRLRAESVDGMYFFLRRRVDFNKRIIATLEGPSILVAINTQNQAELRRYDFNVLLDQIRPREKRALEEKKAEATAALARATDKKERVVLERQIKQADTNLSRLKEGKLWRNRNQLAFCNQSSIPREEFLEMLDAWKRQYDVAPDMNKRNKR